MAEKTNIIPVTIPNNSFYYKEQFGEHWTNDQISAYALDIEIEKWLSGTLKFPMDRIIYASNDYTFRERTKKNNGQLNLPYVSYYKTDYEETSRPWWNNYANTIGIMDIGNEGYESQLGTKLKITPIRVSYECTIFFSQHKDCEYAYKEVLREESNETILYPKLQTTNGDIIKSIGIQDLDLTWNPLYDESDWLEANKIFTIGLDMSYDTFHITGRDDDVFIAKEVILNFLSTKGILTKPNVMDTQPQELLIEYFSGNN